MGAMGGIATTEPMGCFDCNENGRIDFADVVWLFSNLWPLLLDIPRKLR